MENRFISSPKCVERLWKLHIRLFKAYRSLFPRGQFGRGVNLSTVLHLVPRLRISGGETHFFCMSPSRDQGRVFFTPVIQYQYCRFFLIYGSIFSLMIDVYCRNMQLIYIYTGVLISPQPDQEENRLQRQKILMFIYPTYNHNRRNINTIYI